MNPAREARRPKRHHALDYINLSRRDAPGAVNGCGCGSLPHPCPRGGSVGRPITRETLTQEIDKAASRSYGSLGRIGKPDKWPRSPKIARYGVERSRRRRQTLRVRINSRRCGEGPGEWRNVGHKEVPCDPSTKNDAGRTPASQSVQAYRGMLPAGRGGVRSLLQAPTRPVGAGTDPTVPGTPVYRPEIGRQHGRTTSFGSPVLLRQDPEAELERSRDTLAQTTDSVPRRPEPGGGPAVDRVRRQPAAPRLAADAVRDRATTRRTGEIGRASRRERV